MRLVLPSYLMMLLGARKCLGNTRCARCSRTPWALAPQGYKAVPLLIVVPITVLVACAVHGAHALVYPVSSTAC
jgi:hypothetical protein